MPINQRFVLDENRNVIDKLNPDGQKGYCHEPATAVQVLQQLTRTIPIVFIQSGDPVQGGSVQSLARPGGNITGFVTFEPSINTKYLQLLKEIVGRQRDDQRVVAVCCVVRRQDQAAVRAATCR